MPDAREEHHPLCRLRGIIASLALSVHRSLILDLDVKSSSSFSITISHATISHAFL